jgi:hypothetical protein
MIQKGSLRADSGQDSTAIRIALYAFLDRHLGCGM